MKRSVSEMFKEYVIAHQIGASQCHIHKDKPAFAFDVFWPYHSEGNRCKLCYRLKYPKTKVKEPT
jgi:hypothetical protein